MYDVYVRRICMTYMYDVYQCPGAVWGFGVGNRVGAMGKPLARRCFLGVWRWESRWRDGRCLDHQCPGAVWGSCFLVFRVGNRVGAMGIALARGCFLGIWGWKSRWRDDCVGNLDAGDVGKRASRVLHDTAVAQRPYERNKKT